MYSVLSFINIDTGFVLNTNLENIIVMKIINEKRDNIILHSNIIN